jgi:hypothetical protein
MMQKVLESIYEPLFHASALMFVAYTGYGRIATLGEEVHDPEPTTPLGPHPREMPKSPETWRLGPMNGSESPRF